VDSEHYNISYPTYLGAQYDASTTNLSYSIPSPQGSDSSPAELIVSFLSPITPTSTLRQSVPASYVTLYVKGSFDISVYIDVNGNWISHDSSTELVWSFDGSDDDAASEERTEASDALKSFRFKKKHEQRFAEHRQQAEWGELHFTGPDDVHYESGAADKLRQHFARDGTLRDKIDDRFRRLNDDEPAFAFSKHFYLASNDSQNIASEVKQDSVLFTIAHLQDPVVQYAAARGLTEMRPLWKSYFHNNQELITSHYNDYEHAFALAANYSAQVAKDAYASGSDNYKDIVALSARQVLGATVFSGTPDNPLIFLKEISSNGNCQTIDVIFPAFPFFLYTNPRWLAYLLEPLIEHMASGQYPNQYAMHDLGAHFPNFTGHPDGRDEYMPVEECGNILIMGLAIVNSLSHNARYPANSMWSTLGRPKDAVDLAALPEGVSPFALPTELETRDAIYGLDDQWSGVSSHGQAHQWLSRTYGLWKQWTGYLVEYSLLPENQLCTDDFAGWLKLMSNLALKGIVGIRAMSELSAILDEQDDAKYYRSISETYVKKWEEYAMSSDGERVKLAYHWQGSWTTLYSLYANAVLCFHPYSNYSEKEIPMVGNQIPLATQDAHGGSPSSDNFIPDRIYKTQSRWYDVVMQKYGLPLDSRHLYTKSDWEFQAAAVASKHTRKTILERVARWLNETVTDRPFTDLYNTEGDGGFPGPQFKARPVVGSHFAFLSLERACGGTAARAFDYDE